jgi:hypothetical protein
MSDTRRNIGILLANTINLGICDLCSAIHINLYDGAGEVFATALLPDRQIDEFIGRLQACRRELATRHSAPAMWQ